MKSKVIVPIFLCLSILLSSCGTKASSGAANSTPSSKATPSSEVTSSSKPASSSEATSGKKQTITMMTHSSPLAPKDPNEKLIWQRYEAKTSIHVNWTNYSDDVFGEKKNLALASGKTLPDAIFDAQMSDYDLLTNAKNGAIIPLETYIDKDMPNLKAIFDKYPQYKAMCTAPDGHIYSLPWIEELGSDKERIQTIAAIPWINKKWLDNLGLAMPTTPDELEKVLLAFKNKDANGDGNPNDEIPMSFIFGDGGNDSTNLYGAFGYGDNGSKTMVTNDGKVFYTRSQDGYKNALTWMHKLYADGVIDPQVFTQDWNTYVANGKAQKFGLYFTWDCGNVSGFTSGDYSKPSSIVSDYVPLPPLKGKDGTQITPRTNGMGFDRSRFVVTADCKDPDVVIKWADGLYDPVQSAQDNWGTYGDDKQGNIFSFDGKMLHHLPLDGTAPYELRVKTSVSGPLAVLNDYYGKYVTTPDDAAWRMNIVKTVYAPFVKNENIYPNIFFSINDSKELSTLDTSISAYSNKAVASFIIDGKIDAGWSDYLAQLNKLNLQKWIDIKQKGYDASKK